MYRFACRTVFTAAILCRIVFCGSADARDEITIARPDGTKPSHFYTSIRILRRQARADAHGALFPLANDDPAKLFQLELGRHALRRQY